MKSTKIIDFLSRKSVAKYHDLYNETQWDSEDKMLSLKLEKLKVILKHCYDNVPFYRDIMHTRKLYPEDINSIEILQEFPIITKEIIQENYTDFIPKNIKQIPNVKTSQTGGTTGNILIKRTDEYVRSSAWGTYHRFLDWMGVQENDRVLLLMGGHVSSGNLKDTIKKKVLNFLQNSVSMDPYDSSDRNIEEIVKVLETNNFKIIRGYSQSLFYIAGILKERGLKYHVPVITTTAEPLMDEHRKMFKDIFGADSFDQYGCGEIGGIAYECPAHEGLHVAEERVVLEVLENHDLVITDLDNLAMPYIRYYNADQAIMADEKCSCGRKSMLLKKIMGRTCDYITAVDGKQLHWAYFWHLMFDTKIAVERNAKKFQVKQVAKDKILFRLVSDPLSEADKTILRNLMVEKLGDLDIEFVQEDEIENTKTGKYRPVINLTM